MGAHLSHCSGRWRLWLRSVLLIVGVCLCCQAQTPQAPSSPTTPPARPFVRQPRVALALGGGGARGLAHVGVLQVLEHAGVPIDLIVGTSAGSIVRALYADHPDAQALRELLTNVRRKDFVDFSLLHILNGPITGDALTKFLQSNMQASDFSDLKIPFVAVATDLEQGVVCPLDSGPIAPAVHASVALPPYFHSVSLGGRTLVDGGVTAPLPVSVAKSYQPEVVIAVSVSGSLSREVPKNALKEVARSYSITLAVLGKLDEREANLVITPDVSAAKTFKVSNSEELFNAGVKAATESLPRLKQVLLEKGIALPIRP